MEFTSATTYGEKACILERNQNRNDISDEVNTNPLSGFSRIFFLQTRFPY